MAMLEENLLSNMGIPDRQNGQKLSPSWTEQDYPASVMTEELCPPYCACSSCPASSHGGPQSLVFPKHNMYFPTHQMTR